MKKQVNFAETTPLVVITTNTEGEASAVPSRQDLEYEDMMIDDDDDEQEDDFDEDEAGEEAFSRMKPSQIREARAADRLSMRLLAVPDGDEDAEERILRESLQLVQQQILPEEETRLLLSERPMPSHIVMGSPRQSITSSGIVLMPPSVMRSSGVYRHMLDGVVSDVEKKAQRRFYTEVWVALVFVVIVVGSLYVGVNLAGPPSQPVGPYQLIERQEGEDFFQYYNFYEGRDSVGSNGYNMYVSMTRAQELGIVNVTREPMSTDVYYPQRQRRSQQSTTTDDNNNNANDEPFVYMGSSATAAGPRDSIRLEGIRRFDRGLFIIDLRHMPAGCGVWPAFWLTDEANWPVNGEIDIVEGVNYQSEAKTALHATTECSMFDIPLGTMTGTWDTAQGIPDAKTGIPDMTMRYARNCFVYDPHQWINQGCVAVDQQGDTLGVPLNQKGGGVYALEWDPVNRHIRTWVFTPHSTVPDNLVQSIQTAGLSRKNRIMPDPDTWPLPYGYFAIGAGTDCASSRFHHMRLVFNLAFCGSVSGNRFHLDCPIQAKSFNTCNDWVQSNPEELQEAYWKIRGVYVYERSWERVWLN